MDKALCLHQRSLDMEQHLSWVNEDNRNVTATLFVLAEVLRETGDITEAERLHRLSFDMRFHGWVEAWYKLAFRALEKDMFVTAKRLFEECLDLLRHLHGRIKYHVDIAVTLQGLSGALLGANENNKAKSVFHSCLDMWDKLLPLDETRFETVYLVFAFDGEYRFLQNFVSLHRRLIVEEYNNLNFAKILQMVAEKYLERASFSEAVDLFHETLQIYFRLDGLGADEEDHVAFAVRGGVVLY